MAPVATTSVAAVSPACRQRRYLSRLPLRSSLPVDLLWSELLDVAVVRRRK